jgi:hypothetical protein
MFAKLGATLVSLSVVVAMADPSLDFFPRALQGDGQCASRTVIPHVNNLLAGTSSFLAVAGGSSPFLFAKPARYYTARALGPRQTVTCPQDMKNCDGSYCMPADGTCCNKSELLIYEMRGMRAAELVTENMADKH